MASTPWKRRSPAFGALGAGATLSVAARLVTNPNEFVATTVKVEPLSTTSAGLVVTVRPVANGTEAPFQNHW